MKTNVRKSLTWITFTLLLMLCCFAIGTTKFSFVSIANAQESTVEPTGLSFLLNDDSQSYKVRIQDKTLTNIIIPSSYNDLPVTAIDDNGFTGCTNLEKIIIPHSIKHIGNNAFMRCMNLTKVLGMSGVVSYGNNAFSMCSKLDYLILPKGLTNVGSSMLRGVKANVYSRTVESDLLQMNSDCLTAFTGNIVYGNDLVYEKYKDPITKEMGLSLVSWQNLDLQDGFEAGTTLIIESWHEDRRDNISEEEKIEGKLLNIAQWAFAGYNPSGSVTACNAEKIVIKNATGYNHAINLESFAFAQSGVRDISIEVSVTMNDPMDSESNSTFFDSYALESVTLPNNIKIIPSQMFNNCPMLKEIKFFSNDIPTNHLPSTIIRIEEQAFGSCVSMPELYVSENIEYIGGNAFNDWGNNDSGLYQNIYINLEQPGENWSPTWNSGIKLENCNLEFVANPELIVELIVTQTGVVNASGGQTIKVARNDTLDNCGINDPVSDSHIFRGWYTTETCEAGTEFGKDIPIKNDLKLYAGWDIKKYNVRFPKVNCCNFYDYHNGECLNLQTKIVEYGGTYSFYIEINDGYYITQVFVNNNPLNNFSGDVYKIENITEDLDVSVEYGIYKYTIIYENVRKGINPNEIKEYTVESETIRFENPYWSAYERGYWNVPYIQQGSTGHKYIKAIWENPINFTITFNMDDDPNAKNPYDSPITYTVEDIVKLQNPISPGYTSGGWSKDGVNISEWDADDYYEDMTLNVSWGNSRSYTVTIDWNGGIGEPDEITARYGEYLPRIGIPVREDYKFLNCKLKDAGGTFFNENMSPIKKWYYTGGGELIANWEQIIFTITLEQRDGIGVGGDTYIKLKKGQKWEPVKMPQRDGYYNNGYFLTHELPSTSWQYFDENGNPLKDTFDFDQNITLFTIWHPYNYRLYVDSMTYGASVEGVSSVRLDTVPYATVETNYTYTAPETMEYTYKNGYKVTFGFTGWKIIWRDPAYFDADTNPWHDLTYSRTLNINVGDVLRRWYPNLINEDGWTYTVRAIYSETVSSSAPPSGDGGCVAEGTLVTLADGSKKPVEKLTGEEMLLAWNLKTGTFDKAKILFIDKDPYKTYETVNLYFSDGTNVKVISEHGFWNLTLNKYVYLDNNASIYIGHWFNKQAVDDNGHMFCTKVQLSGVEITYEYTSAWSPVTYGHLCYYVNGMLSIPGGIEGLFNIFTIDETTMKYDEAAYNADIALYGLFTYEELSQMIPISENTFNAINAQYLKVAIGKGLITIDELADLYNRYAEFLD